MAQKKIIRFRGKKLLYNDTHKYSNGRKAIELYEEATGEPYMMVTVNIPMVALAENEVIVKDYSENEGIYLALLNADILAPTGKSTPAGFTNCPIARIL